MATIGLAAIGEHGLLVSCGYFAAQTAPTERCAIVLNGSGEGPGLNAAVIRATWRPSTRSPRLASDRGRCTRQVGDVADLARTKSRRWWGSDVDSRSHLVSYDIAHAPPGDRSPFSSKQRVALGDGLLVCGDHRDTPSVQGALFSGRCCREAVASMFLTGRASV